MPIIDARVKIRAKDGYSRIEVSYEPTANETVPDFVGIDPVYLLSATSSPQYFRPVSSPGSGSVSFVIYCSLPAQLPATFPLTFGVFGVPATYKGYKSPLQNDGATSVSGSFNAPTKYADVVILDVKAAQAAGTIMVDRASAEQSILHLSAPGAPALAGLDFSAPGAQVEKILSPIQAGYPDELHIFIQMGATISGAITVTLNSKARPGQVTLQYEPRHGTYAIAATVLIINTAAIDLQLRAPYTEPQQQITFSNEVQFTLYASSSSDARQMYCVLQKPDNGDDEVKKFPDYMLIGTNNNPSKNYKFSVKSGMLPVDFTKTQNVTALKAYAILVDLAGNIAISRPTLFEVFYNDLQPPTPLDDGTLPAPILGDGPPLINIATVDDTSPLKANMTIGELKNISSAATGIRFRIFINAYALDNPANKVLAFDYNIHSPYKDTDEITLDFDTSKLLGYDSFPNGQFGTAIVQYMVLSSSSLPQPYSKITKYSIDTKAPNKLTKQT